MSGGGDSGMCLAKLDGDSNGDFFEKKNRANLELDSGQNSDQDEGLSMGESQKKPKMVCLWKIS